MFEATLHAVDPDRQRLQRLTFATGITLGATAIALASMLTLDRLGVDRIAGPSQQFELAQFSLLPPPQTVETPPAVKFDDDDSTDDDAPSNPTAVRDDAGARDDDASSAKDELASSIPTGPRGSGIPGFTNAIPCPGGVCGHASTSNKTCVGPNCGPIGQRELDDTPPADVEFSALRCLACADPDSAALRKAKASTSGRTGTVALRFCVDVRGRVEARSIEVERSYGDATVDRIVRKAIEGWRFSPMKIGNQPRRACSRAKFEIRFD
jgi:TonB family protein